MAVVDGFELRREARRYREDIPEHLRPREYGKKEVAPLRLKQLIMFDQVRSKTNPKVPALRESLKTQGLINQIDVAKLDFDALAAYARFVNRVWKAEHTLDNFTPDHNGFYYVVIAGHSRTAAMMLEEMERAEAALEHGFITDPLDSTVWCKIHEAPTPEAILALQLAENLYEAPPEERRAMAVIEAFEYGKEIGSWKNQTEFIRSMGSKFSRLEMQRALAFLNFEPELRAFVLDGTVRYAPAVELGMVIKDYREYVSHRYFDGVPLEELPPEQRAEAEAYVREWTAVEFVGMERQKLNVTAARKKYRGLAKEWKAEMAPERTVEQEAMFDLAEIARASQRQDWRNARERLMREHEAQIQWLFGQPLNTAAQSVALNLRLFSDQERAEALAAQAAERIEGFVRNVGERAVTPLIA